MKNNVKLTAIVIVIAMIGFLLLFYTNKSNTTKNKNISGRISNIESGIRHIDKYVIYESGMKYILYREADGGLFGTNITKDSLELELLHKKLKENK